MNIVGAISSFVHVVEAGSIAAAARSLGISPAAVSQNVARLEAHLATRLLTRTTRRLALTEAGTRYYERVRHIPRELDLARQAVAPGMDLQDSLRIATTPAFGRHVLAPLLPAFKARYPGLRIEVIGADRRVDHVQERIDVSIRIQAQLADGLVAREIAARPFMICAAPAYLERAGTPATPEQLRHHACLVLRYPTDGRFLPWGFVRDGERFDAPVNADFISDDVDVLAQLAVHGAGVARLASFVAAPLIAQGRLVALFDGGGAAGPQTVPEPMRIYACVTDRAALTPKVRAFIDYLGAQLGQVGPHGE
ncbi:LysR family transcriptional regulator [uncultured Massilia sp.]|uniref:LysR family transcriptional regulator n=1 Tax=uncultured Massilia sp. TaxID=169973 RepID=UPI0025EF3588|nr:LysR family transcriptional regulator [uncultured Massilia sp.]